MKSTFIMPALLVAGTFCADAAAQTTTQQPAAAVQFPLTADVQSIDGIVRAFFDVVSGPAGQAPDRARDESLHFPGARISMSSVGQDGRPTLLTMDLDGYYQRFGAVRSAPFHEREIHREVQEFGNIAQVWSTYAFADAPDGPPAGRGITSLHLYFDGSRWWITSWTDQRETPANPLPLRYLPR